MAQRLAGCQNDVSADKGGIFMRLLERTLMMIEIAPRAAAADGLGGVPEGFSAERLPVRASVIPFEGGFFRHESGAGLAESMCLLLPADARIEVGDGVCLDGGAPKWRCVEVQRWSAHCAAKVERIAG